jgi:hypothetical protein
MLYVIALCLLSGASTVLVHQEGLRAIARLTASIEPSATRVLMLGVIFGIFALHMVEIGLYTGGYAIGADLLHLGRLVGDVDGTSLDYLYFSAETFTSLGFGDIVPDGSLRLLASFEPLNGLILLGWSASFIYVEVQRTWPREIERQPASDEATRPTRRPRATAASCLSARAPRPDVDVQVVAMEAIAVGR